jgi:CRP-like cAMP-binding protein
MLASERAPLSEPFRNRSIGAGEPIIVRRTNGDIRGGPVVERAALFSGMLPGDYASITAAARVKEFARDETIYFEGDPAHRVVLLISGFAKIAKIGSSGAEVILRFSAPGDLLGAVGVFSTGRHCTTARAFRACRVLVWEAPVFKSLVDRFPVLHQTMARILGTELMELEERFREVATERVGQRVASQLLRLMDKMGRPVNGAIEVDLSREDLAQMTGTTLFTVSRLLSAWEAEGMVRPRREVVTICDVQSLRAVSE